MTEQPTRRGVLRLLGGALGGLLGAAATLPGLAFLAAPLRAKREPEGAPIPVARLTDLPVGKPVRVRIVGPRRDGWLRIPAAELGACWLVKQESGQVAAFSTVCPHLGCGIDWNPRQRTFECPCHGSFFDGAGRRTGGPSPRDMDALEVGLAGDEVSVVYRRFRIATGKKEPIGG